MSALLESPTRQHPATKRFTREETRRMQQLGLIEGRYELINGDLIDKMGQNPPHASSFTLLQKWLLTIFGAMQLRFQLPIEVAPRDQPRNEPEPDIAVLAEWKPEFFKRHPQGDELLVLIEIADSSADFDLSVKANLYARAGVPEYWVLDVSRRNVTVHRGLQQGQYISIAKFGENDRVVFACSPERQIQVAALLPPV